MCKQIIFGIFTKWKNYIQEFIFSDCVHHQHVLHFHLTLEDFKYGCCMHIFGVTEHFMQWHFKGLVQQKVARVIKDGHECFIKKFLAAQQSNWDCSLIKMSPYSHKIKQWIGNEVIMQETLYWQLHYWHTKIELAKW